MSDSPDPARHSNPTCDLLVDDVATVPLIARMQPTAGKRKSPQGVLADPWEVDFRTIADWTRMAP